MKFIAQYFYALEALQLECKMPGEGGADNPKYSFGFLLSFTNEFRIKEN